MHILTSKKIPFLFSLIISFGIFAFSSDVVSAISWSGRFNSAAVFEVTRLEVTRQDYDTDRINKSMVDDIASSGSVDEKIALLNKALASQIVGAYVDNHLDKSFDYEHEYSGCKSFFREADDEWELVQINVSMPGSGDCKNLIDNKKDLLFKKTSDFNTTNLIGVNSIFKFVDENTMVRVDGRDGNFVRSEPDNFPDTFFSESNGDSVTLRSQQGDYFVIVYDANNDVTNVDGYPFHAIGLAAQDEDIPVDEGEITPNDGSENSVNSCESTGGVLGWVMCPIAELLDGIVAWLDGTIQSILIVESDKYNQDGNGLYTSWSRIRNIAYILLVPTMLIMVIGTALGFEVFSAYTVKRALPRMVAATIFIALSWYICTFLIQATNVIGTGILGLLTNPFDSAEGLRDALQAGDIISGSGGASTGSQIGLYTALGTAAFGALATGFTSVGIIMSTLFSAAVILGVVLLVLVAREMFILMLLLVAPLAILSWIFPGNDKPWKLWWNIFSKLLLMFPLVMGLIATGRIFASVTGEAGAGGDLGNKLLLTILIVGAYIIPYIAIPFTFKWVGGFFGSLAGMANNAERGLLDRNKNWRQKKREEKREDAKNYERFGRGGRFSRGLSTGAGHLTNLNKAGFNPRNMRGRMTDAKQKVMEAKTAERLEEGGARAFNDDDASEILQQRGISGSDFIKQYMAAGHNRADAVRALGRAENAIGAKVGSNAMAVAALKFRVAHTNTAYEVGEVGVAKMQRELGEMVRSGLITEYDAAGWMKSNKGRAEFSTNGYNDTVKFIQEGVKPGSTGYTARMQIEGAFRGADPREILGSHQRTIETFAEQAKINWDRAKLTGDQKQIDYALADLANVHDMLSNTSAKKAEKFADEVYSQLSGVRMRVPKRDATGRIEVDSAGNQVVIEREVTVREAMEAAKSRPADNTGKQSFLDRRRELSREERQLRGDFDPGDDT